jgi:hypothetical protein
VTVAVDFKAVGAQPVGVSSDGQTAQSAASRASWRPALCGVRDGRGTPDSTVR